jgi:hypothetical protein
MTIMKTKITYIAIFIFSLTFSSLFAQGTEGETSNSNYASQRNADLQQTTNAQATLAKESSTVTSARAAAADLVNYQAVARDAGGLLITNTAVTIDFMIHEGTAAGTVIFTETQNLMTDANGVFAAQIGSVTPLAVAWGANSHFLEVMLNGTSVGTTEFVSVPYAKSADTMPVGAAIGDGSVSSADVVTIVGDNTVEGEIIDIRASNVVTIDNDLMNMDMPAGSSVDAQFIEARNGGDVQFQVQGDGRTLINATTTAPVLNTVYGNSMPIAFGSVALGFSDIQTGYGITSFANPAVGEYDIEIDHATDMSNCVVLVTPYTGAFGAPEICGYEPTGTNTFKVRIQTVAGVATNSAFTFVVYGNH